MGFHEFGVARTLLGGLGHCEFVRLLYVEGSEWFGKWFWYVLFLVGIGYVKANGGFKGRKEVGLKERSESVPSRLFRLN